MHLLQKAAAVPASRSIDRLLYIAAFCVSSYSFTEFRTNKPFNPLLGETYEYQTEDNSTSFMSEQVSHHPPITAFHLSNREFSVYGDVQLKNKFWGKTVEIFPVGNVHILVGGEHFTYEKVITTIHNIIIGTLWLDHNGDMPIINHTNGSSCKLNFSKRGMFFGGEPYVVTGVISDSNNNPVYELTGKWNESLSYRRHGSSDDFTLIWKMDPLPEEKEEYYYITPFGMQLNEFIPPLHSGSNIPPTDSRLRPDLRALDDGRVDDATNEKLRLEEKQRAARKVREERNEHWHPLWFEKQADPETKLEGWLLKGAVPLSPFTGAYYDNKWKKDWHVSPNIF